MNTLLLQGFVYIKKAIASVQSKRADGEECMFCGTFFTVIPAWSQRLKAQLSTLMCSDR